MYLWILLCTFTTKNDVRESNQLPSIGFPLVYCTDFMDNIADFSVLLYYSYSTIAEPSSHQEWQRQTCERLGLMGRIRVASEGLNGTVSGSNSSLSEYKREIESLGMFHDIEWKISKSPNGHAFSCLKV